jgi:hypothetical protein
MSDAHSIQRTEETISLDYRHKEDSIMPVNSYECICLSNALDFLESVLYLEVPKAPLSFLPIRVGLRQRRVSMAER